MIPKPPSWIEFPKNDGVRDPFDAELAYWKYTANAAMVRLRVAVEAHQCIVATSPINSAEAQISGRALAAIGPLPSEPDKNVEAIAKAVLHAATTGIGAVEVRVSPDGSERR